MREPSWGDHLRPVPAQMSQGSAQTGRRCGRGSALLRGMLWHGTVGSACVTPAHVRPETRKRRAINACDMLPPLISGSIVQRKHRATQATCDNVCHTAQRRACGLQTGPPTLTPTHSAPCRAAAQPGVTRRGVLRALSPARACREPPPVTPPSPAHTKRKRRADGACVCVRVSLCVCVRVIVCGPSTASHETTATRTCVIVCH
jgi:hypothetical protein